MIPADILTGLLIFLTVVLTWLGVRAALRWTVRKMHTANARAFQRAREKWAERPKAPKTGTGLPLS